MKKISIYLLLAVLTACDSVQKTEPTSTPSVEAASSEMRKCFCDTDGNLNLISDSLRDKRMERWHSKIAALYPNISKENLPKGFKLSVEEIKSMSEFLNSKNPQPQSVTAYFTFDSDGAADSGRVTAVFVPNYPQGVSFSPCKKGCTETDAAGADNAAQSQNINLDLTQPCPPICGAQ